MVRFTKIINSSKGFTLVELLMVLVILFILTGIAIPSYLIFSSRVNETATEAEMGNIIKALEMYKTDHDLYPITNQYPSVLENSKYLSYVPSADKWGKGYQYLSNQGITYVIKSTGINGTDGGNDDIVFSNGLLIEDGAYSNK